MKPIRILRSLALIVLTFVAAPALAKEPAENITVQGITTAIWLPAHTQGAPVVIFSHGFHGCATQSTFLMKALADAGYAVFAPNHKDATCNGGTSSWRERSQTSFKDVADWNDKTYADRRADIEALLDALPQDPRFRTLNWHEVGLAGHSLGGYTVLGLGGGWASWHDARIKAVLALSPYSDPFIAQGTLKNIHVPVMYQGGTRDVGITPSVKKNGGAYDETPAPKYFIELQGAGHFAWTDLRDKYQEVIDDYSIAFFDTYLKGKPFPAALKEQGDGVAELRIKE